MNIYEFGNIVNWGVHSPHEYQQYGVTGSDWAEAQANDVRMGIARSSEGNLLTKSYLESMGITGSRINYWRQYYLYITQSFPENLSAPGRVVLFDAILRSIFGETPRLIRGS